MRVAFDVGGCLSKYPDEFKKMTRAFRDGGHHVYLLTDMHPVEEVAKVVVGNGILGLFPADRVLVADYAAHGDSCKAVLLREHRIDVFVDDHPGYLVWPWPTPAPLRLRVEPDPRRPYWHPSWKCGGGDFGRRVFLEAP